MRKKIIYTAGPMDNVTKNEATDWRMAIKGELEDSGLYEVYNPYYATEDDTAKDIWERDYFMLDNSDIVLVNLDYDKTKPYLGLSMEIGRAFYLHKPIIVVSSYDWVHTNRTIQYHATKIVTSFDKALEYLYMYYK